jgi:5-methylcytosine-specific restriction endonuclease McrA
MQPCPKCQQDLPLDAFPPSCRGKKGSWCRACHREKVCGPPTERACDWCEDVLVVTALRAAEAKVFCSRSCKNKARTAAWKQELENSKPERACRHCGDALSKAMRSDAAFCSPECNSAAHGLKRGNGRFGPGRRRDIVRAYIIERDRSICHICGKKCRPGEITLDHVIPLAKGGTHAEENLRVAHLSCNCAKRDRGANDQLMLVG